MQLKILSEADLDFSLLSLPKLFDRNIGLAIDRHGFHPELLWARG